MPLALHLALDHAGHADAHLEAFAAHVFEEDAQMHQASSRDHEFFRSFTLLDLQGHVAFQFLVEAILELARGDKLAFTSNEGTVIDPEGHMQGGFIDEDRRQGGWILEAGDGVADLDVFDTDHRTDVPRLGSLDLLATEPLEEVQFLYTSLARFCVGAEDLNLFMLGELAGGDTTDGNTTDELGVVKGADP